MGLIAVAVGFIVGAAVRKGSDARGGWRYQALAMFLTYASIVSAYVPEILGELKTMAHAGPQGAAPSGPAAVGGPATPAPSPAKVTAADEGAPKGLGGAMVGLGVALIALFALALVAPFLGGFQNIMGIVIIGIGVYEAWKLNKRQVVVMTGPHSVGSAEHG